MSNTQNLSLKGSTQNGVYKGKHGTIALERRPAPIPFNSTEVIMGVAIPLNEELEPGVKMANLQGAGRLRRLIAQVQPKPSFALLRKSMSFP